MKYCEKIMIIYILLNYWFTLKSYKTGLLKNWYSNIALEGMYKVTQIDFWIKIASRVKVLVFADNVVLLTNKQNSPSTN